MENAFMTRNEEKLMNLLWESEQPLTSVDLVKLMETENWKQSYVLACLRSLKKKGMIKIAGSVRYVTQYARQFEPCITREEYAAKLALSCGISGNAVLKVSMAMAKETEDQELYQKLQQMISEYEDRQ